MDTPAPSRDPIAALRERGVVTDSQVARAREAAADPGNVASVLEALIALGYLDRDELAAFPSILSGAADGATSRASPPQDTVARPEAPDFALAASLVSPAPPSPSRRRIGRFEIVAEVGRGGMGVVYRAIDTRLGRTVAIKGIAGGVVGLNDPEAARFLREARTAARLRHPGIIAVHDVDEVGGQAFLVMDFVDGKDLMAHLRRNAPAPIDLREAAGLVTQVAEAIAHAHAQGILHRDLKPDNVLVDGTGRAMVGDFGLAKEVDDAAARLTASGAILGTPAFMAPEQAEGKGTDARTDVYGLGAILYTTLCGKPPAEAVGMAEMLWRAANVDPVRPSKVDPRVPRDLEVICLRCLEKEPGRRYAGAQAVADDLGRWLRGEAIAARPASRLYLVRRWVRLHPLPTAGFAAAAAALVLAAAFAGWGVSAGRSLRENEFYRTVQVRVERALGLQRAGDLSMLRRVATEAVAEADDRLRREGDSAAAHFVKGWILRLSGKAQGAEAALSEAVRLRPDDASARYQRGLARIERFAAARAEALRESQGEEPSGGAAARPPGDPAELERRWPELVALRAGVEEDLRAVADLDAAECARELGPGSVECIRGLLALARGDRGTALRDLEAAVKISPDRDEAHEGLIACTLERLWWGEAVGTGVPELCDRAIQSNRGRWQTRRYRSDADGARAAAQWREGKPEEAAALWQQAREEAEVALSLAEDEPLCRIHRARLLFARADLDPGAKGLDFLRAAIEDADHVLRLDAASGAALSIRGSARALLAEREGEGTADFDAAMAAAIADYTEAIRLQPTAVAATHGRGNAHLKLARRAMRRGADPFPELNAAVADFDAVLRERPRHLLARTNRASAAVDAGRAEADRGIDPRPRYAQALADLDATLAALPDLLPAREQRAKAHWAIGDACAARGEDPLPHFRAARADFDYVLARDPARETSQFDRAGLRIRMAMALDTRGEDAGPELDGAIADYDRILASHPDRLDAAQNRGIAHLRRGFVSLRRGEDPSPSYQRAIRDFSAVLSARPRHVDVLVSRAQARAALGAWQTARGEDPRPTLREALADAESATKERPGSGSAQHMLGCVREQLALAAGADRIAAEATYRAAAEAFAAACAANPASASYRLAHAGVALALAELDAALGRDPRAGYRTALARYDEALERNRNLAAAWRGRGMTAWSLGRAERSRGGAAGEWLARAEADLRAAAERHDAAAWFELARLLESEGRVEDACTALEAAARQAPALAEKVRGELQRLRDTGAKGR